MAQVELFMRHAKGRSASYRITTSTWREYDGLRRVTLAERTLRMPVHYQPPPQPGVRTVPLLESDPKPERCLFCGETITEGDHRKCIPEGFGEDVQRRRRWPWRK